MALTIVRSSRRMELMSDDLPALGRPMTARASGVSNLEFGISNSDLGNSSSIVSRRLVRPRPCAARGGRGQSIARDAGLIMHDGDVATDKSIEERGFPDVGSPDDRDLSCYGLHWLGNIGVRVTFRL